MVLHIILLCMRSPYSEYISVYRNKSLAEIIFMAKISFS